MNPTSTDFTQALTELPGQIKELQTKILTLSTDVNINSAKISSIESKLKVAINSVTDINGKKLYSNAEAREAELAERAKSDPGLTELVEVNEDLNLRIQELKIELECLSNTQRNTRALLNFFAGQHGAE
jgi:chromosome segregation ATPase